MGCFTLLGDLYLLEVNVVSLIGGIRKRFIVYEGLIRHFGAKIEFPCQILKASHHFTPFPRWHVAPFFLNNLIYAEFDLHIGYYLKSDLVL